MFQAHSVKMNTTLILFSLMAIYASMLSAADAHLVYSTFHGPVHVPQGWQHTRAVSANDSAYIAGPAPLDDRFLLPGGYDTTPNGKKCFVARIGPDGSIQATTLFGGDDFFCQPFAITVDQDSNVYIAGAARGPGMPTTEGAFDREFNGGRWGDGFVAKFSPDLSRLIYATYLGSSNSDEIWDLAVDPDGNLCIMGGSMGDDFPVTPGAYDSTYNGGEMGDAIVAKLSPDGRLLFATYVGGVETDMPAGMAVDAEGNILIGGLTRSPDYPITRGCFDSTLEGESDCGISLINADGSTLLYSTFLGGDGLDNGSRFAYDDQGRLYFAFVCRSTDFPVTSDALDHALDGERDIVYGLMSSDLSELHYASYLGGSGDETINGVQLDQKGRLVLQSTSDSNDYPVTADAWQRKNQGKQDCVLTVFDPSLRQVHYSTYLGGSQVEHGAQFACFADGRVLVSGVTRSADYPVSVHAQSSTFSDKGKGRGGGDAFTTILQIN